jgi:catechol 2,3-dioxygenase-like lactoylglutathione lyase family enzyme
MSASPPPFGLGQIGQIAVPVRDVERAIAFYRDVLGMRFLFQAPPGLGFFDCAGVRLMLDGPAGHRPVNTARSSTTGQRGTVAQARRPAGSAAGVVISQTVPAPPNSRT